MNISFVWYWNITQSPYQSVHHYNAVSAYCEKSQWSRGGSTHAYQLLSTRYHSPFTNIGSRMKGCGRLYKPFDSIGMFVIWNNLGYFLHIIWRYASNWFITKKNQHYCDVIMDKVASQITSLAIVYLTVYSDADQRKHPSSASLAFVCGIHWGPVNSPHKCPVTRKIFPFEDVIMRKNT